MKIENLTELIGKRVVVTADHGTMGYLVSEKHLRVRRIGARGTVGRWVPGHGGDVVTVLHDGTTVDDSLENITAEIGVYCHLTELEFETPAVVAWAQLKAELVAKMEAELKAVKESEFKDAT